MAGLQLTTAEIEDRIKDYKWFQSFEIAPGVTTPGIFPMRAADFLDGLGISKDLSGKKTLDIGCMEGAIAFEMDARGAQSFAVDIQNPDEIGFNLVKEIKGADVDYRRGSVYDLAQIHPKERFDLVCYKGVFYHLKDPIGAFEAIADVMAPGGRMIVAGECLISYAVGLGGEVLEEDKVREMAESDVPLTVCYPGEINGVASSTWFVPNVACLKSWLDATGWELESYTLHDQPKAKPRPGQRFLGIAKRKDDMDRPAEHPVFKWKKNKN